MAGGTGNLILKRGTAIPDGSPASLLKAMPAVQLIGLSPISNDGSVFNTGDTKAFANYPNRLWVGMDALGGTSQAEGSSGTGGNSGGVLPLVPPGSGGAISSQLATRPVWMGAEIRANVAVFHPDDTGTSAVPTVLEADWTNPSDYVLVTQKSIQSYVTSQVTGKGTMSSFDLAADTGTTATITNAGTITIAGGASNGIDTSISGSTVTVALDISEIATLSKPATTANILTYDVTNGHRITTVGGVLNNISGVVSVATNGTSSFGSFSSSTLATALSDETGTDKVVFNTSPTLVTSLLTSSNSFDLLNSTATTINFGGGATTAVNIGSASGIVAVAGDLRVSGNDIQMSGGTTALTFSGSGDVAVNGDLTVTGNDIKMSGGTTALTFSGSAEVTAAGHVNISAGKVIKFNAPTSGSISLVAKNTTGGSAYTLTLPADDGASGQVLTTDGNGNLDWADTGIATSVGVSESNSGTYTLVLAQTGISGSNVSTSLVVDGSDGIQYDVNTDTLTVSGDLAVNGSTSADITTTTSVASLYQANATTLRIGTTTTTATTNTGGATTIHIGDDSAIVNIGKTGGDSTLNIRSTTGGSGIATLACSASSVANVFNTNATTVNVAGASTNLNLGSTTTTVNIAGNLVVSGTTTTINSSTLTVDDKNIELGSVVNGVQVSSVGTVGSISGSGTTGSPWVATITNMTNTSGVIIGSSITATASTGSLYGGSPTSVKVTAINSSTSITYEVVGGTTPTAGNVTNILAGGPSNITADGGGITLKGTTDKTINWSNTSISGFGTGYWQSSENFSVEGTKAYLVGTDPVLTKTYLRVYNSGVGSGSVTIKSPNSGSDIGTNSYTLPTTLGSANQVLTVSSVSGGNDAILSWVDQSSITAGSVTVRREATGSTTKYPIPFFASNAQDNPTLTQSGNDFSSWSEAATKTGYLYSDYTSQSINGGPTNKVAGLMYEVSDDGSSTVGTLYCDYIGATLDCGSY